MEIRLGTSLGLTGPDGPQVYDYLRGFLAQLNETSSQGGIHKRRLTLLALDHGAQPKLAVRNTLSLINDTEVFSLVALGSSDSLLRVLPLLSRSKFSAEPTSSDATARDPLLFGAWSGAQPLYSPAYANQIFCFRPSFQQEMDVLIGHLIAEGRERISICFAPDATGRAIQESVQLALGRHGSQLVAEAPCLSGRSVESAWQHLRSQPTDTVICALNADQVAEWIKLCQERSWPVPIALPSIVGGEILLATLGKQGQVDFDQEILQSRVVPTLDEGDPEALALKDLAQRRPATLPEAWRPTGQIFERPLTAAGLEGFLTAQALIQALELAGPEPNHRLFVEAWAQVRQDLAGATPADLRPSDLSELEPPSTDLLGQVPQNSASQTPESSESLTPKGKASRPTPATSLHGSIILARAIRGGKWRRLRNDDPPAPSPSST